MLPPDGSDFSELHILENLLPLSLLFLETEISSGARPALPMGVAPEAIVKSFSSIGSSKLFSCVLA
jgi:hypothetical protein